jgi:hypothetical protein
MSGDTCIGQARMASAACSEEACDESGASVNDHKHYDATHMTGFQVY